MDALELKLYVVDVHRLGQSVAEGKDAVARLELDLARGILIAFEDAQRLRDYVEIVRKVTRRSSVSSPFFHATNSVPAGTWTFAIGTKCWSIVVFN